MALEAVRLWVKAYYIWQGFTNYGFLGIFVIYLDHLFKNKELRLLWHHSL